MNNYICICMQENISVLWMENIYTEIDTVYINRSTIVPFLEGLDNLEVTMRDQDTVLCNLLVHHGSKNNNGALDLPQCEDPIDNFPFFFFSFFSFFFFFLMERNLAIYNSIVHRTTWNMKNRPRYQKCVRQGPL